MATKNTRRSRKHKKKVPKGYDSRLEYDLHNKELKGWVYHPEEKIQYEVPHNYEPDFSLEICCKHGTRRTECRCSGSGKEILIEVKGRFRERREATKYIYIKEALKENQEIIFLFQDANKPMPHAQRRKDGTKQTHGEWAEKNGFKFYCLKKGLPKTWLKDVR